METPKLTDMELLLLFEDAEACPPEDRNQFDIDLLRLRDEHAEMRSELAIQKNRCASCGILISKVLAEHVIGIPICNLCGPRTPEGSWRT